MPSANDMRAAGLGKYVTDRSTHPNYFVSSWPVGLGHRTLAGRERYRLPHLSFNSVLITVIGNEYHEGAWWRLQDMMRYTEEAGYEVALEEVDDASMMPSDAIGIMRACAAMLALDAGVEWCFMVDCDALLEKDTLVKLIERDLPVCYPFIDVLYDDYPWGPTMAPRMKPDIGMGVQPVIWSCMSVMLFNTKVFNCLDAYSWHGHDLHFAQCLAHYGHRIMVDMETVVKVTRGPGRTPSKEWDELWSDMESAHRNRQTKERDRRPPPDWDPAFQPGAVDPDGVYWAVDSWKYGGVGGRTAFDYTGKE